jgi:hypothetical protein
MKMKAMRGDDRATEGRKQGLMTVKPTMDERKEGRKLSMMSVSPKQSINHTSGYIDMYRTMSLVAKDIDTIILFESPMPKSIRSFNNFELTSARHGNCSGGRPSPPGRPLGYANRPLPLSCCTMK